MQGLQLCRETKGSLQWETSRSHRARTTMKEWFAPPATDRLTITEPCILTTFLRSQLTCNSTQTSVNLHLIALTHVSLRCEPLPDSFPNHFALLMSCHGTLRDFPSYAIYATQHTLPCSLSLRRVDATGPSKVQLQGVGHHRVMSDAMKLYLGIVPPFLTSCSRFLLTEAASRPSTTTSSSTPKSAMPQSPY